MIVKKVRIVFVTIILMTCSYDPKPIEYGLDVCSYCSMTIVDDTHAAELITEKGKVYKYDSIECMLRSIDTHERPIVGYYVMDFNNSGQFIDATKAVYFVSEEIPSPMGANLSAFKYRENIRMLKKKGIIFDWESIRDYLNKIS